MADQYQQQPYGAPQPGYGGPQQYGPPQPGCNTNKPLPPRRRRTMDAFTDVSQPCAAAGSAARPASAVSSA
ncbi:hypothetical protein V501_08372 [Pseudogymnoascus sp. VKM F-4519 (FW-2642)]|nr:hypothetical protein V501_08372 [Pseudogymnoascus sp. VKM F-4519 (FW-2642)]